MIDIDIAIESPGWPSEEALRALVEVAIAAAMAEVKLEPRVDRELSMLFTDDAAIRDLNNQWRGKDSPTNVLSFPASPLAGRDAMPPILGDIVLAYETVAREAGLEGKPFDHHLTHLVVHGFLHLLGHDHEDDREAEAMEALERSILSRLAIPDPYG